MVSAAPGSRGRGGRVGNALSATELCVVERGGPLGRPSVRRLVLDRMNGDNGAIWPSLADALREVARTSGHGDMLAIALMPSVCEVRHLELPPMRDQDMRVLLTRSAARYFAGARTPQIIGIATGPRRAKGTAASVVSAAAPSRLVTAIFSAARDAGWQVESVSPAEGAWAAAAGELWPASARERSPLLVLHDDHTDLLQLEAGRLAGVRRFRAGNADEGPIADAIVATTRKVAVIGASGLRNPLAAALARRGIALVAAPSPWQEQFDAPDVVAAAFAGTAAVPLLEGDDVRAARDSELHRAVRWAAASAAGLLLLAAAFELWGVHRELAAVQAQRAALRSQVAATLVGRTSVETAFRQLATLAAEQRTATQWSAVVAGLSAKLDEETYLTAFRGRADSVVVDGLATRAALAFDAVERTTGLIGVHAAAPVRREAPSGGPALERFTIAAQVAAVRPLAAPAIVKVAP